MNWTILLDFGALHLRNLLKILKIIMQKIFFFPSSCPQGEGEVDNPFALLFAAVAAGEAIADAADGLLAQSVFALFRQLLQLALDALDGEMVITLYHLDEVAQGAARTLFAILNGVAEFEQVFGILAYHRVARLELYEAGDVTSLIYHEVKEARLTIGRYAGQLVVESMRRAGIADGEQVSVYRRRFYRIGQVGAAESFVECLDEGETQLLFAHTNVEFLVVLHMVNRIHQQRGAPCGISSPCVCFLHSHEGIVDDILHCLFGHSVPMPRTPEMALRNEMC